MAIQYKISPGEIVDFLLDGQTKGFTEDYIQETETRIGAPLPPVVRDFMLKYGPDTESKLRMHDCMPPITSYEMFQKALKDFNEEEADKEDPFYKLSKLPIEQWGSIVANFVWLWENDKVDWRAGFLLSDLQARIKKPRVYVIRTNGKQKKFNNAEDFLMLAMIYEGINVASYIDKRYIDQLEPLKAQGIDRAKLRKERYYPNSFMFRMSPNGNLEELAKASGIDIEAIIETDDFVQAGCCIVDDKLYFYLYDETSCEHQIIVSKRGSGKK